MDKALLAVGEISVLADRGGLDSGFDVIDGLPVVFNRFQPVRDMKLLSIEIGGVIGSQRTAAGDHGFADRVRRVRCLAAAE